MKKEITGGSGEKKKLLLHSCCGPCSTAVIERLEPFFDITVFYFNPNITESEEYNLRLNEQKRFIAEAYGDKIKIIEGRYKSVEFFLKAEGLQKEPEGGKRCEMCFAMRLFETARAAAEGGFDSFTSSLFISPYQNHELMRDVAERAAHEYGVEFLYRDFRPYFKDGQTFAREHDFYIQKYCGCVFSEQERYLKPKKIIP